MVLPKVIFTEMPISLETDWVYGFLFKDKWGWKKYVLKKHPKLKQVYSIKNEGNQVKFIKQYIINFRKLNRKTIENSKKRYQKAWNRVEKLFFTLLREIMNTNWPKDKKEIKAMISINPICPRFLNNWSFSLFCKYKKIKDAVEVIMHECCHFLYFKKWQELYPKANKKTFEYPYIEWHLSELAAPIILDDKRIQKYLKKKAVFYTEYYKIKIENKTAPDYFTQLYRKNIDRNNNFELFIREAYKEIKKRRKLFLNI